MKPSSSQQAAQHWRLIITHLLPTLIRWGVGGIFLLFSISKLLSPLSEFKADIAAYSIIPTSLLGLFGMIVICCEIVGAVGLIIGLFTRASIIGISGLLVMFVIAITQALLRGIVLADCGCSGSVAWLKVFGESPGQVLLRDGIMLVGLIALLMTGRYGWTIDGWLARRHQSDT